MLEEIVLKSKLLWVLYNLYKF